MKLEKILPWVVVAGAFYTLYLIKDKLGGAAGKAAADIYAWLRGHAEIRGKLVLPDHTLYSFNGLQTRWVGNRLLTTINAVDYQIYPHDERGNYPAVRADAEQIAATNTGVRTNR